jgi:hypothetical protein
MKRPLIVLSMLMLVVAAAGCNFFDRRASNEIVARVEQFKKATGRLPNALSDIGVKETENCPCYCKTSNDSYVVWYGTTLGESDTFDSRTKQWSEAAGAVCSQQAGQ